MDVLRVVFVKSVLSHLTPPSDILLEHGTFSKGKSGTNSRWNRKCRIPLNRSSSLLSPFSLLFLLLQAFLWILEHKWQMLL